MTGAAPPRSPGRVPALVILVGPPGAGKTTFYRARFAATHVHVGKDPMRNVRGRRARELALVDEALAAGRSVVVDDVNATVADRAALGAAGRRRGAAVVAHVLAADAAESLRRNRSRTGRARVPDVAVHVAARRFQPPTAAEGFDRLEAVRAEAGRFAPGEPRDVAPRTVFLLSPASTRGERGALLMDARSEFPLAVGLRTEPGVPLGEAFSFLSALYFRGKLTCARAFGLRDAAEPVTLARLRRSADVPVGAARPRTAPAGRGRAPHPRRPVPDRAPRERREPALRRTAPRRVRRRAPLPAGVRRSRRHEPRRPPPAVRGGAPRARVRARRRGAAARTAPTAPRAAAPAAVAGATAPPAAASEFPPAVANPPAAFPSYGRGTRPAPLDGMAKRAPRPVATDRRRRPGSGFEFSDDEGLGCRRGEGPESPGRFAGEAAERAAGVRGVENRIRLRPAAEAEPDRTRKEPQR